jgi:hypothetical protein
MSTACGLVAALFASETVLVSSYRTVQYDGRDSGCNRAAGVLAGWVRALSLLAYKFQSTPHYLVSYHTAGDLI